MSKRPAADPLEFEPSRADSPATPKRARVDTATPPAAIQDELAVLPSAPAPAPAAEEEDEEEEEGEREWEKVEKKEGPAEGFSDLYLDTVDRRVLDFGMPPPVEIGRRC
jgi:U4/U6.U5 tri-snRNP-associated protein 2